MYVKKLIKKASGSFLSRLRPGNVMMLHIGRCGSTVLAQLLQQNNCIYWGSELYEPIFSQWIKENDGNEKKGKMPDDAISILKKNMQSALHHFYGFEIKPFHFGLIGYSYESFFEQLALLGFSHFIILDRKNRLRKIVSSLIAHQNGSRYHISKGVKARRQSVFVNTENVSIDFDSKSLLNFLSDYDKEMNKILTLLKGKNILKLFYEDDIQDNPKKAYLSICDFLNIKPSPVSVKLSRTNPFPLADLIENFDAVEMILRHTPYSWMLYG